MIICWTLQAFGSLIGLGQLLQNTFRNPSAFYISYTSYIEEEAGVTGVFTFVLFYIGFGKNHSNN